MRLSRQTTHRLLAILVVVAVVSFAFQAAGHWHSNAYEDQHCRVCHFAHSISVDLSNGTALPLPGLVSRFAAIPRVDPTLDTVVHQLSSRGPPSA